MQDNTEKSHQQQRLAASDVLKFIQDILTPSPLTFESNIPQDLQDFTNSETQPSVDEFVFIDESKDIPQAKVQCPIYFKGNNENTIVLPPASIVADQVDTLDQMLDKIKSTLGGDLTSLAGKDIVIPIMHNTGGSKHFVTLFYSAHDQKITVYNSSSAGLLTWLNNAYVQYPRCLQTSLRNFGLPVTAVEEINLGLQVDDNSCGYWARCTAIALANKPTFFTPSFTPKILEALIKSTFYFDNGSSELLRLWQEAQEEIFSATKSWAKKRLMFTLRRIKDDKDLLKKIIADRQGVNYNGESLSVDSDVTIDVLIAGINKFEKDSEDTALISLSEGRFLEASNYPGLKDNLSMSQRVIFDSIIMECFATAEYVMLFNKYSQYIKNRIEIGLENNVLNAKIEEYSLILYKFLKEIFTPFWVTEINQLLAVTPDLFVENGNVPVCLDDVDVTKEPFIFANEDENEAALNNMRSKTLETSALASEDEKFVNVSFEIFKIAVKVTLAIALIAIIFVLVVAAIMHLAVVIPVAAVAGAGLVAYGGYKLFQCCSSLCDDGETVHPESQGFESK